MMRGGEVDLLAKQYPHLAAKAVEMENAARANGSGDPAIRGLGMNTPERTPWSQWIGRPKQIGLFEPEEDEMADGMPCGCHE